MVKIFVGLSVMVIVLGFSAVANAEEQLMVPWPNQRASHQANIEDHGAAYKARGDAYVEHMYTTGGETPLEPEAGTLFNAEIQPVPINIGQVADMVNDTVDQTSEPSPDAQTAATPQ